MHPILSIVAVLVTSGLAGFWLGFLFGWVGVALALPAGFAIGYFGARYFESIGWL